MAPIHDTLGVEQGGCLSDRLYKLANNEQHQVPQSSGMGVDVTHACISSIGLADDSALLSNDVFKLQNLVLLTQEYCAKNHVELVPEKTKLLCFVPKGHELSTTS